MFVQSMIINWDIELNKLTYMIQDTNSLNCLIIWLIYLLINKFIDQLIDVLIACYFTFFDFCFYYG